MTSKANKLQKQLQRALAAQETYANTLVKEKDVERKRRTGRLIKLGTIAVQFMEAGDKTLLGRFEEAVKTQFANRKVDRLDFGLDDDETWFDRVREEQFTKGAKPNDQNPSTSRPDPRAATTPTAQFASPQQNGAQRAPNAPAASAARPAFSGAPAVPSGASPSTAST